ncbi:hypothetical protein B566_EDAN004706 [Ephemera danica]|nr:hypothetical protein B566_EDAN004706 [Ephemera danica]
MLGENLFSHYIGNFKACNSHYFCGNPVAVELLLTQTYNKALNKWKSENLESYQGIKYKASDKINKPMTVKEGAKTLSGSASQNRIFLRLFPLIISDMIAQKNNKVWKALLILRQISKVVCSHEVSPSKICELQSNIE